MIQMINKIHLKEWPCLKEIGLKGSCKRDFGTMKEALRGI